MKAIRIHQHGSPDVLKLEELDIPLPEENEVLVKIKAAALNHLDIFVRQGIPGVPLPVIMGSDGAGVVEKTGSNVRNFKQGDEVINVPFRIDENDLLFKSGQENLSANYQIPGEHCDGLQAEYVLVPAMFLLPKPKPFNWAEAAAFPLATMTAYHMLKRKVQINPGDWVLVYGASSGVGSAAIQIAKNFGGHVITTVGDKNKEQLARKLGADFVLNYKDEQIGKRVREICPGGVDIVFEHTGAATWKDSLKALKIGGKIVTCGATTGYKVEIDLRSVFIKQQQIIGSTMGTLQDMKDICRLAEEGKLSVFVSKIFNYKEIKEAHEWLEKGKQFGKVIIEF